MKAVGIISEYNPFHEGHAYQIEKAKELTGADFAVVVMNGDFMQRGEPAIFGKYTRTQKALEGGADIIFELPVRYGLSSAGDFALGGVLALTKLGFVSDICFGSECGDIHILSQIARLLSSESPAFKAVLDTGLSNGLSYPAARSKALHEVNSISEDVLNQPNNILGIEYCLALLRTGSPLNPITIARKGQAYHDTLASPHTQYPSASAIRASLIGSEAPHLCLDDFSGMIGYALLENHDLTAYKDITQDLADRIRSRLSTFTSASSFADTCQTRTFTLGRIRRSLLQCLLHIQKTEPSMPYLRLLGMRKEASCLLRQTSSCPILSRLSIDSELLAPSARLLLAQDIFAADLYRQVYCYKYQLELPNEYQHSPIVLP